MAEIKLQKAGENRYKIKKFGQMLADVVIYVNENLKNRLYEDQSLEQLVNAAELKGVISPVVGMPDIHEGYGLPIGGVMAMDAEKGLISVGAVGYDINCGVKMAISNVEYDKKKIDNPLLRSLMIEFENLVPAGVGKSGYHEEFKDKFNKITQDGALAIVKAGYGNEEDLENIEEYQGKFPSADISCVSEQAVARGIKQIGTIGGGNHFFEIQVVEKVYNKDLAEKFGIIEGNISLMVHSGSRGFGHQIASDYLRIHQKAAEKYGVYIPARGLVAAPIKSKEGKDYYCAMACAMNFAFANRQMMLHDARTAFKKVFGGTVELQTVYDVAHNSAKFEELDGKRLLIHRKGATRAFPVNHPLNIKKFKETGHPVIVPGSMGTGSYVMVGLPGAKETFYSVNHGSGRLMSRAEAKRKITQEEFEKSMGEVLINTRNWRSVVDEAPTAYKDIDEIVDILEGAGITKKVCRTRPLAVVKGTGMEG